MRYRFIRFLVMLGLFAAALPAFTLQPALAAGVVGDGSAASCNEAALDAALSGGGLVTFNCGLGQITIPLTTIKVIANDTQIDGNGLIRLDMEDNDRHFYVAPGSTLDLNGIRLDGGSIVGDGGSIRNDGTVIASAVIWGANFATGNGGAIRNDGTLTITDSFLGTNLSDANGGAIYNGVGASVTISGATEFLGNLADIPGHGGAIYNAGGTVQISGEAYFDINRAVNGGAIMNAAGGNLTVSGATFDDNFAIDHGGAIHNESGTVSISDTLMLFNHANDDGGALFNATGAGAVTVERSTFSGNDANRGGAIWNADEMSISASSVAANEALNDSGGGIFNANAASLEVIRSVVYSNTSGFQGGGLFNGGAATFQTSTFSSNEAVDEGGGILNAGQMTIADSTVAFNTSGQPGGGIGNVLGGTLNVANTIITSNPAGDCANAGVFNSNDFNLDGDGSCPLGLANDISGGSANLSGLGFNGGTTLNHLPGFGSDAIDAGPATCASPDQRGESRPRNGACDIGAVETIPATDVCYSVWTGLLQMPVGGQCVEPYFKAVVFTEGGPHYLCANPYTGMLSYGKGPICAGSGLPAIQMPAAAPLAVCRNPYTGQLRLPPVGHPCGGGWVQIILS